MRVTVLDLSQGFYFFLFFLVFSSVGKPPWLVDSWNKNVFSFLENYLGPRLYIVCWSYLYLFRYYTGNSLSILYNSLPIVKTPEITKHIKKLIVLQ